MKMHTIYKRKQGKEKLLQQYEAYLQRLGTEFERVHVPTRWGNTHVLVSGPKEGKPICILQGGNCLNPMTLSWFQPLLQQYRVIAPDTIGHPGLSDEVRLSASDDSLARWVEDILDYFHIERCAFVGPSYGAGITLRLAAFAPERISCAVLVAPAGLILGSKWRMIRSILLPLWFYQMTSSGKQLHRIADAMSTGTMKPEDEEIIGDIFRHTKLEQDMPKLSEKQELQPYKAPTMVVGGTADIFFPGEGVVAKAKEVLPNLVSHHLYEMGHFPAEQQLKEINEEILLFLQQWY
ncbi:alpha/beta fold hydrolase [Ectobacillus ponti]|uniref:Alpha/beta hydrolase n=1 Tax=Ectobacillus ponti TaxID=2961894 RepID=A0AA41X7K2_9BACI|nr:alpha/beta hydrolase [Ectobacillus ponti]MCP8970386.1 alpha/beta hydrolase [Ectobacillus ponti]